MRDEIVPRGKRAMKIELVRVRKWAQVQIPLERVVPVELKAEVCLAGFHQRRIFESVAQPERAIVVKIVAEKHVGGGGLLGDSLQSRMRLDERHRRQPAAVGN